MLLTELLPPGNHPQKPGVKQCRPLGVITFYAPSQFPDTIFTVPRAGGVQKIFYGIISRHTVGFQITFNIHIPRGQAFADGIHANGVHCLLVYAAKVEVKRHDFPVFYLIFQYVAS
ncbi:hypothetical protein SDC9_136503 [bioreactor metagenome]|uniref:Uncharacterized protein n=1 Tax=bioreactor metagenome TaxID=1076179 RepID=A0A645DIU0_9ZZZZ